MGGDEVFEYVEVEHHTQEYEQGEDHEVFHRVAVGLQLIVAAFLVLGEDEWLVGKSECLYEHHHDYGDLVVGAIYSKPLHRLGMVRNKQGIEDGVDGLVHYSGYSENEQRKRVAQHLAQQGAVEPQWHVDDKGKQREQCHCRCYEIGEEDVAYAEIRIVKPRDCVGSRFPQPRAQQYEKQVEPDVEPDVDELQPGKFKGHFLVSQIGERYRCVSVDRHRKRHEPHVGFMPRALHGCRHGSEKQQHQQEKDCRGGGERYERCGVDFVGVSIAFVVGETEEPGLHSVGEDNERYCHDGVDVDDHTILCRSKHLGVQRHETPVEEASYDAA